MRATCWIHRQEEPVPTEFLHEHHRQPRAYGGEDDPENLVWLCNGCHDILHRLATMLSSGKSGLVEDLLNLYIPDNPAARERLRVLMREVLQAKTEWKAEDPEDGTVRVTLQLPTLVHAKLKSLSTSYQHESGRPVGVAAFLVKVLSHYAETNGRMTTVEQETIQKKSSASSPKMSAIKRPPQ